MNDDAAAQARQRIEQYLAGKKGAPKPTPQELTDYEQLIRVKEKLLEHWKLALNPDGYGVIVERHGTTLSIGPDHRHFRPWMQEMPSLQVTLPGGPGATAADLDWFRIVIREHNGRQWTIRADRTYLLARHDPVVLLQSLLDTLTRTAYRLAHQEDEEPAPEAEAE
jgi:hypothetical protein